MTQALRLLEKALEKISNAEIPDVEAMQKVCALIEQEKEEQKQAEFDAAFFEMQTKAQTIQATRYNEQTRSWFADLASIYEAIQPLLTEHGFSVSYSTRVKTVENTIDLYQEITATITHKSGIKLSSSVVLPIDKTGIKGTVNKTDVHGHASTTTYGKRYALCNLLALPISRQLDNDGNKTRPQNDLAIKNKRQRLSDALSKANDKTRDWFKGQYSAIEQVPLEKLEGVTLSIEAANRKATIQKTEALNVQSS